MTKRLPQVGSGQIGLPLKHDRCVTPRRASDILTKALGHGYSACSVKRLCESGEVRAHRVRKGGWWFIEMDSIVALIQRVLNEPPA